MINRYGISAIGYLWLRGLILLNFRRVKSSHPLVPGIGIMAVSQ